MRVLGFTESAAALQWLGKHVPALIITDHLMPGPTGLDVARAVRAVDSTRAVPILMLTGSTEPALHAQAREAGITRIATKPLRLGELLQLIEELVPCSASPQRL
jgi:CheY-like chemotaxis protein